MDLESIGERTRRIYNMLKSMQNNIIRKRYTEEDLMRYKETIDNRLNLLNSFLDKLEEIYEHSDDKYERQKIITLLEMIRVCCNLCKELLSNIEEIKRGNRENYVTSSGIIYA
jgi:hypothetical protein